MIADSAFETKHTQPCALPLTPGDKVDNHAGIENMQTWHTMMTAFPILLLAILASPCTFAEPPSSEQIHTSDDKKELTAGGRYDAQDVGVAKDPQKAIELFCKSAREGDVDAKFELGRLYAFGPGVKHDWGLAAAWYREAVEGGHPEAQAMLDILGVEDQREASCPPAPDTRKPDTNPSVPAGPPSFEQIHASDDEKELTAWGRRYAQGFGVTKDPQKAIELFCKAAGEGDVDAKFELGQLYAFGPGVKHDWGLAAAWYREAVAGGHPEARTMLDILGVKDQREASCSPVPDTPPSAPAEPPSFEQIHASDDEKELTAWGRRYAQGFSVAKDPQKAIELFCKSADKGDVDAKFELGQLYAFGSGVEHDWGLAAAWYREAVAGGHPEAQAMLDILGVKDQRKASCSPASDTRKPDTSPSASAEPPSFRQVHASDDKNKLTDWGRRYAQGIGGAAKDPRRAIKLFCKSARKGDVDAKFELGQLYAFEPGIERDWDLAAAWYREAAEGEHPKAQAMLDILGVKDQREASCSLYVPDKSYSAFEKVARMVQDVAPEYELDPDLVLALIEKESRFKPKARSHRGAKGLMQLMSGTAKDFGVKDVWDLEQNLKGAAWPICAGYSTISREKSSLRWPLTMPVWRT